MKLLSTTAFLFFLITITANSLPISTNISNSGCENHQVVSSESESELTAKEIINNENTAGDKESIQLAAGKGRFKNPSRSTGANSPDVLHPKYINNHPAEYVGGRIVPEPLTLILLSLGISIMAIRRII